MNSIKRNWPLFACTGVLVATLVACTASINAALKRPRYGDAIDLMSMASSMEKTRESAASIEESAKSIDRSVDKILEQMLMDRLIPSRRN